MASRHLIVFDMGGVLVRIWHSWDAAAKAAGRPGCPVDYQIQLAPIVNRYERGKINTRTYVREICRSSDQLYQPDDILAIHRSIIIEIYPGAPKLLLQLEQRGVRTAVLSNTDEAHWSLMEAWHLFETFAYLFPSHQTGVLKPGPKAYSQVEEASGYSREQIVYFDDREENVAAARSRSWQAFYVDPYGDPIAAVRNILLRLRIL